MELVCPSLSNLREGITMAEDTRASTAPQESFTCPPIAAQAISPLFPHPNSARESLRSLEQRRDPAQQQMT